MGMNAIDREASRPLAAVVLWLFVIFLGVALGAGVYESRIVVPQWLAFSPAAGYQWNADAARAASTGENFWVYVTTVPLTLLTLASLGFAWRSQGALRRWWLAAAAIALVDRVFTFSYFIPTMLRLIGDEGLSQPEAAASALRWARLDYVRHAIVLLALLATLRAFALFYRDRSLSSSAVGAAP